MRYLISTAPVQPIPSETRMQMIDGIKDWADRYTKNGKIEAIYSFAGKIGGCGIINVKNHEELESMMVEFPPSMYSHVKITPLVDLNTSLKETKKAMEKMMEAMA